MDDVAVQPQGCTHFRLRRLLREVARLYDAQFAAAGLKGTQFSLLSQVIALEPVQPTELARRMGLDASTLTRNLSVMVQAGWIVQAPGPDARTRRISATAAGRAKQIEARRCWRRAQRSLQARLGTQRLAALHTMIDASLALLEDPGSDADRRAGMSLE